MNRAALRRKQIDSHARGDAVFARPCCAATRGIAETRKIIGMRADQLGRRVGVAQATVTELEQSEANGTISLNSLKKVAAAMDCRLVYAFVPEKSFEELVDQQAMIVVRRALGPISHAMALENQRTGSVEQVELLDEYAAQLARCLPRDLWDADG